MDDACQLDDDPAPATDAQLWSIGGREDTKLAADPKEYIMTILEHDMDEVKGGKQYYCKTKPPPVHPTGHPIDVFEFALVHSRWIPWSACVHQARM